MGIIAADSERILSIIFGMEVQMQKHAIDDNAKGNNPLQGPYPVGLTSTGLRLVAHIFPHVSIWFFSSAKKYLSSCAKLQADTCTLLS